MKQRLIFGLLALNFVFFIWASSIGDSAYQEPAATLDGVPSLTLLPVNKDEVHLSKNTAGGQSCYTLGPFNNKKSAKIVAEKISSFGLAVSIHKQKTLITLNYMVYLKPLPSRKEAEKVIAQMDKFKIKEYSIVESGPYKNAIALGAFEDLDKARRHSEYVRFLGYDAKYTEQKKRKEVYWVDYDEPFGTNTPVLKWAKEVDPRLSVQKIPKACEY